MTKAAAIVVVGGGYAGVRAATLAARALGGKGEVVLVSPEDTLVERIRLHEHVVHGKPITHAIASFLEGTGVRQVRARVTGMDPVSQTLTLDQGALTFERLVLTVGSEAVLPEIAGVNEHAFSLSVARAEGLHRAIELAARRGGRVVVCGGGLTGVETATELAETHPGLRVTLLTSGEVAHLVSRTGREHVRRVCARLGVALVEGLAVTEVSADRVHAGEASFPYDVCIWAGGFRAPHIVHALGLETNGAGQAVVDENLRAKGHAHVFVAGDAAAPALTRRTEPLPMGCKTALPQSEQAAANAVRSLRGEALRPFTFTDSIFCISLGRKDGLIQRLTSRGSVVERVITGRAAAIIKELVCRFTIGVLHAARGPRAVFRGIFRQRTLLLAARTEASA